MMKLYKTHDICKFQINRLKPDDKNDNIRLTGNIYIINKGDVKNENKDCSISYDLCTDGNPYHAAGSDGRRK